MVVVDDDRLLPHLPQLRGGGRGTLFVHKIAGARRRTGFRISKPDRGCERVIFHHHSIGMSLEYLHRNRALQQSCEFRKVMARTWPLAFTAKPVSRQIPFDGARRGKSPLWQTNWQPSMSDGRYVALLE